MRSGESTVKFGTVVTLEVPSCYNHIWSHGQGWGMVSFERCMMTIGGCARVGWTGGVMGCLGGRGGTCGVHVAEEALMDRAVGMAGGA